MTALQHRSPSGFEKLPAELYDEIFSHVVDISPAENPPWGSVTTSFTDGSDDIHVLDYLREVRRDYAGYLPSSCVKLRLVSKAFNRAVSRVWFQYEYLKLRAFDKTGWFRNEALPDPEDNLERRVIKPNSVENIKKYVIQGNNFSPFLRRLRLQFSTEDGFGNSGRMHWLAPKDSNSNPVDRESLLALLNVLPSALEKVEQLECLWVNLTESWESIYSGTGKPEDEYAPDLDLFAINELRSSLCRLFSPTYAHKFRFLTELRLSLPCTYDFAALNKAMSDEATERLKHLYLEYVDATGPGGSSNYLVWAEEGDDGDESFPPSNLQKEYPNHVYMHHICELVGRCINLESLGLHATHYLNLDELDWKPAAAGLRNIYIYRAVIHSDTLIKLLGAADGRPSNIFAVNLNEVHLLDHTWARVLDHLLQADALQYFNIRNLNYALHGESAELSYYNNRPMENISPIWTNEEDDEERLESIVKKVLDAGGLVGDNLEQVAKEAGYDVKYPNSSKYISGW
ncbi:unnamed protein product [Periconia digitata]|uniref:Uncharacterized protein n=1 Tax=Periconia digitata TaxID=1303443 RepID=A0A9W4UHP5_9PLEO|nr:unnamed protein product [Periconia digitata]